MTEQTILLVDDNPTNLRVLTDYLHMRNFRILTARNGQMAIKRAFATIPDLVLLDVMMPDMNGFDVCATLKSDARMADVPVIFMTALSDEQSKVRGFDVGGIDYITKPIKQRELLARINTHLRIQALTNNLQALVEEQTEQINAALVREQMLSAELRQALDKSGELNRLQQQIINVISHEFRTPLNQIAQFTDMLASFGDRLSPERKQLYSSNVRSAIERLTGMLSNVLTVNKLESADISWPPTECDVSALIEKSVRSVAGSDADVTIRVTDLPEPIYVVENVVAQLLHQLLSNSLKFRTKDSTVLVGAWQEGTHLMLCVQNEGQQIPVKDMQQIFEPFYKGDNAEFVDGMGLGLFLGKRLAEWGGGKVWAENMPNGVRFQARLPMF